MGISAPKLDRKGWASLFCLIQKMEDEGKITREEVGILDDLCVAEDHRLLQAYIDHTEGESFFMRILPLLSKGSASASSWLSELQNVGTTAPSAVHVALSPGKSSRNAVLFTTPENPARTSRTSSGGSNPGVVASSQPRMIFQDGEHLNQEHIEVSSSLVFGNSAARPQDVDIATAQPHLQAPPPVWLDARPPKQPQDGDIATAQPHFQVLSAKPKKALVMPSALRKTPVSLRHPPANGDAAPWGATLPGATMPGATLPGATLPGATLPGATLPGATLPGATLPGATLPDVTLPDQAQRFQA